MDKLKFIGNLDEEQSENAVKVARMAKEAGVDPVLAVAIAYKEGSLRTNAPRGTSGEIGMMQVMPKTGMGLGYDEKKLSIPNQNIKAGIDYLKMGLQATENDPQLAAIFYNGGPGAVQALKLGKDPDPRVFDYVRTLNSYGTFADQTRPAENQGDLVVGDAPPPPPPTPNTTGASPGERFLGGAVGTGTGLFATGVKGAANVLDNRAVARATAIENAKIAAQRAAGVAPPAAAVPPAGTTPPVGSTVMRPPGAPTTGFGSQVPVGPADAGRMAKGQTGAGVYNYAKVLGLTDIEAARALDMTKQTGGAHDISTSRREGLNKVASMFPNEKYVENPRYGGLLTLDQGAGSGFKQSFKYQGALPAADLPPNFMPGPAAPPPQGTLVQLPPWQPVSTAPIAPKAASGLDAVTDMFKGMFRPVATVAQTISKYALPPLAGLSAGLDVAEIGHEYDKPEPQRDYTKMGLKAASAIGGGLSMFPPTAAVGIPLSLGATAAQAYRDNPEYIKKKMQGLANVPLLNEMTEPLP